MTTTRTNNDHANNNRTRSQDTPSRAAGGLLVGLLAACLLAAGFAGWSALTPTAGAVSGAAAGAASQQQADDDEAAEQQRAQQLRRQAMRERQVAQQGEQHRQRAQQAGDAPVVTVAGEGRVTMTPDRAVISLGATSQEDTAVKAQNTVNNIVRRATEAIEQLELEGLVVQTSRVSLRAVYDRRNMRSNNEPPELVGYAASLTISVRVDDIAGVSKIIDEAMEQGVNQMNGISFTLADDRDAQRDALSNAVADARSKARTIAGALGMPLGELIEVREAGTDRPEPRGSGGMARSMMSMDAASPVPTPVEAGEIEVTARIQMTYRLGD